MLPSEAHKCVEYRIATGKNAHPVLQTISDNNHCAEPNHFSRVMLKSVRVDFCVEEDCLRIMFVTVVARPVYLV